MYIYFFLKTSEYIFVKFGYLFNLKSFSVSQIIKKSLYSTFSRAFVGLLYSTFSNKRKITMHRWSDLDFQLSKYYLSC